MDRTLEPDGGQRLLDQSVCCVHVHYFFLHRQVSVRGSLSENRCNHLCVTAFTFSLQQNKANQIDRKLACFHLEASTNLTLSNSYDDIMYAWFMSQLSQLLIRCCISRVYNISGYNSGDYNSRVYNISD